VVVASINSTSHLKNTSDRYAMDFILDKTEQKATTLNYEIVTMGNVINSPSAVQRDDIQFSEYEFSEFEM
jgi:hypothetical protein